MNTTLKYVPILRLRSEEQKVLTSFAFGQHIFPCVEVIKEVDRKPAATRKGKKVKNPAEPKTFEQIHAHIIAGIACEKVFIDFPVQMKIGKDVKPEVIAFLRKVAYKREVRTDYMCKLSPLAHKIIPVISTYSQKTGEANSITLQEKDLRPSFPTLAFRTFPNTFENDLLQIAQVAKTTDFLLMDLDTYVADPTDEDMLLIVEKLSSFTACHITVLKSAMNDEITNIGLEHGNSVYEADNRLLKTFMHLKAHSFGDYAGVKKDKVSKGGGISPGFILYNPIDNKFYGFRGSLNSEGKSNQELGDFETIIVPDVVKCDAVKQMENSGLPYLCVNNRGWQMIKDIERGETGKSMAKFKRISMEHYLHTVRTKIEAGHFG